MREKLVALLGAFVDNFIKQKSFKKQDDADLQFDKAITWGKEFNLEKEKVADLKRRVDELKALHPEDIEGISILQKALGEKERLMNTNVREKLGGIGEG